MRGSIDRSDILLAFRAQRCFDCCLQTGCIDRRPVHDEGWGRVDARRDAAVKGRLDLLRCGWCGDTGVVVRV